MNRHHTIRITADKWEDKALVERIRRHARSYAGSHPGVMVTVIRKNPYMRYGWETVWRFLNVSKEAVEW